MLREGGARVEGIELGDGTRLVAPAVVLATGTFLGGRLFRGEERMAGGRIGEAGARRAIACCVFADGASSKTGTPPRLDARTIDWARLEEQPSDSAEGARWTCSTWNRERTVPQIFCAITPHQCRIASHHRRQSRPLAAFTGAIRAAGPRFSPSISDKIHRFADRDGHQVFLETRLDCARSSAPNGISTSLPADVQLLMLRTMESGTRRDDGARLCGRI